MPQELLLIDKPKGITSFDVIRRLRRELGVKKIGHGRKPKLGHAGTLDPLASGLMIIGVGSGTKKLEQYIKLPKTYEAEIIIGERRSTGDMEGEILEEREVSVLARADVENALASMVGMLDLPVPVYSAIKQDGKPLYKKARAGKEIEPPIKQMKVHDATLHKLERRANRAHLFVTFDVGSGTYIRSLAEELGRRLGYPATLGNLRRTKIGEFDIKDAGTLA